MFIQHSMICPDQLTSSFVFAVLYAFDKGSSKEYRKL